MEKIENTTIKIKILTNFEIYRIKWTVVKRENSVRLTVKTLLNRTKNNTIFWKHAEKDTASNFKECENYKIAD